MDEIAEAAGVTKPVLYQHFPSKRALYVELLEDTGRQLLEHARRGDRAEPASRPRARRARLSARTSGSRSATARRSCSCSARRCAPIPSSPRIVDEILDAAAETISTLIEIPAPDEQRQMLANALVGMAESVGRKALRDPTAVVDGDQLAQWISELAWFGLRGVRTDELRATGD